MIYTSGNNNIQEHERWVDIAKGMAMISVLYVHAGGVTGRDAAAPYYIQLFFFLSGYVFASKYTYKKAMDNAFKIIKKYFKLSLIVYALAVPIELLYHKGIRYFILNTVGIIYSRNSLYYSSSDMQINFMQLGNGPMWYLTCLAVVLFLVSLYLKVCEDHVWKKIMWIVMSIVITFLLEDIRILLPWGIDIAFFMSIFFILGMELRREFRKKIFTLITGLIGMLAYAYMFRRFNLDVNTSVRYYGEYNSILFVLLISVLGIPMAVLISKILEKCTKKIFLETVGKHTLIILAFHSLIYRYIDLFINISQIKIGGGYGLILIKVSISASVCIFISIMHKKRMRKSRIADN